MKPTPAIRWISEVRGEPARSEAMAGVDSERAGSLADSARPRFQFQDERSWHRIRLRPRRSGVSTIRTDFGFRSLNDVDSSSDRRPERSSLAGWSLRARVRRDPARPGRGLSPRRRPDRRWAPDPGRSRSDRLGGCRGRLVGAAHRPGQVLDTDKFGIICVNLLGSRYGTSGPISRNAVTGKPYGRAFPRVTVRDQARAQWRLLDALGIGKLALAVGGSLGGMVALEVALERPGEISRSCRLPRLAHRAARRGLDNIQLELIDRLGMDGLELAVSWPSRPIAARSTSSSASAGAWRPMERLRSQLPSPPGPKVARTLRRGHVPDARLGDGHARHRPRPRGAVAALRRLAAYGHG